jgi:SP family galactose:H+ symporter-like MFS transporter
MQTPTGDQNHTRPYVFASVAAIAGLLFGYNTGVISGALLLIKQDWSLTAIQQGMVVSSVLVGALLGSAMCGKIADLFGRRSLIMATAVIFVTGSFGTGLAPNVELLIAGRFIIGMAVGFAGVSAPLYVSEIAPSSIRGALVSFNQLAISLGVLLSYSVNAALASFEDGWRYMLMTGAIPGTLLSMGMLFLPDSPRWLMTKKHETGARRMLKRIGVSDVERELESIRSSLREDSDELSWVDLFRSWLKVPLLVGLGLMFFQQFTGVTTVVFYAPTIFQMAGFESASVAILATVGVGVIDSIMNVVSIRLVDRVGRKVLLSLGLIGLVVSLGILGIGFAEMSFLGSINKWVVVGSLFLYMASFSLSLGPVCALIISEIFPVTIRGLAMSVVTVVAWLSNIIISFTFLSLVGLLTPQGTFWLFAFIGVVGWFFCRAYVPETKGVSLEAIEEHWRKGGHPTDLR